MEDYFSHLAFLKNQAETSGLYYKLPTKAVGQLVSRLESNDETLVL